MDRETKLADWLSLMKDRDSAIRTARENRGLAKKQEYDALMGLQEEMTNQFPEWYILAEILPSGVSRLTIVDKAAMEREVKRHSNEVQELNFKLPF